MNTGRLRLTRRPAYPRAGLLGAGLLGAGWDKGNRHIGPPYYLLNDTYTTNRSAGAVSGTNAEPGPGRRVVADSESKLSLASGRVEISGGKASPSWSDPILYYPPQTRQAGRILMFRGVSLGATQNAAVGWSQSAGGDPANRQAIFYFADTGPRLFCPTSTIGPAVATWATATPYDIAAVLRSAGAYFFIKGGAWAEWSLLWFRDAGATATLYPIAESRNVAVGWDRVLIPAERWLPVPLASDGFSAWGTTDGLGHAEGVAGGLGSGGAGLSWDDVGGSGWSDVAGQAAPAGGSGIEYAVVDTGVADVLATVKFTRDSDYGGLIVRYADGDNYVRAIHNGTNAQLIKVVNGTPTTLINTAATYAAGAEIRVTCAGQKFRLFYGNVAIGAEQTIADASLQGGTKQGLISLDGANRFDDFMVYAVGTGGEYSELDDF